MADKYTSRADLADAMSDLMARVSKAEAQHLGRRAMHEEDHALWRLDEYILEEVRHNSRIKKDNYPSFTSNAPRTLSRAVMAMLTKNAPRIRLSLPVDVTVAEGNIINANERLIEGAIYENDLVRGRRGDNKLQQEIVWYIAHRGGVIIRPLVMPESKELPFPIDVYDPYECAWDDGYMGLTFFVRHYREEKASVVDRWDFDESEGEPECSAATQEVEMFDIWWMEKSDPTDNGYVGESRLDPTDKRIVYNCVIAGNKWAKMPTAHTEFAHLPVYVIRSGGSPSRMGTFDGDTLGSWRVDQWESIYTNVRTTIGWINRAATLYSLYLRDGAIGPWVYAGGKNKNIGSPRAFTTIRIAPGETFGPVGMPQMANEAKEFMAFVQNEWSKAGVSDVVFGNLPFTVSGFGMLQLRGAIETLIGGYVDAVESAYTFITHELTEQFVSVGKRKKFEVKGVDSRGKAFMEKISPKDVTTMYVPQITLKDGMPDDPTQKGNAAQLWKQAGVPDAVIFEQIFDADDSGAWVRDKRRQDIGNLPIVLMLEAVADLVEAGRTEAAKLIIQQLAAQGVQAGGPDKSGNVPANATGSPQLTQPRPENAPPEIARIGEAAGAPGSGGRPVGS